MKQVSVTLSTYTADVSGVCSALYELGGMVVIHDPSGCNSTYNTHDEPRWYDMDSLIFISGLSQMDAIMGNDDKFINDIVRAAKELKPRFIALVRTPIPLMTGTDFEGIARVIEKQTQIPVFYFPTSGMHSYVSGAGMALETVARELVLPTNANEHFKENGIEIENVSNETEELLNETEDIANETENVSDEAETVSDETAESAGLRDQSGFVENSFRYSNGQPIQKRSAGAYAISDTSNAYKKINGVCYNSQGEPVEGAIGKVIDVSEHNQDIDWEKVKNSDIDFAILRVGYGNDVSYQDDKKWQYNVSECTRLGIPFGVYIYSYAENTTEAESEADHVLRLIKGYNLAYPVYYDLEDNSQVSLGNDTIQKFAETFCNKISNAGYQVGVYANLNWWNNYLTGSVYNNWHRWVAQYNYQCDYNGNYDMWQCTSKAQVDGISTDVDVSFYYGNLLSDADVNTPVVEVGDTDLISYCANIQNDGWTDWKKNGHTLGTIGKSLRLEALKIQTNSENLGVSYTGLVAGYGWTDEVQTGAMLGTEGQSRALEAIKLNLTGDDAENYDIYYRVHSSNFGWLGWAKNGEKAGTEEDGYAIEAVQIAVLPKGSAAPGETADAYHFNEEWNKPSVKYTAHVQNVGWQPTCCNQETAGTIGKNQRLEALQISLSGRGFSGDIHYSTHVEDIG